MTPLVPNLGLGRQAKVTTRKPGDLPSKVKQVAVGCDGKETKKMTTLIKTVELARTRFVPALFVMALGVTLITITGHVQASALHDAAHDVRHATGFPCH